MPAKEITKYILEASRLKYRLDDLRDHLSVLDWWLDNGEDITITNLSDTLVYLEETGNFDGGLNMKLFFEKWGDSREYEYREQLYDLCSEINSQGVLPDDCKLSVEEHYRGGYRSSNGWNVSGDISSFTIDLYSNNTYITTLLKIRILDSEGDEIEDRPTMEECKRAIMNAISRSTALKARMIGSNSYPELRDAAEKASSRMWDIIYDDVDLRPIKDCIFVRVSAPSIFVRRPKGRGRNKSCKVLANGFEIYAYTDKSTLWDKHKSDNISQEELTAKTDQLDKLLSHAQPLVVKSPHDAAPIDYSVGGIEYTDCVLSETNPDTYIKEIEDKFMKSYTEFKNKYLDKIIQIINS